jgi:hypothetical protein
VKFLTPMLFVMGLSLGLCAAQVPAPTGFTATLSGANVVMNWNGAAVSNYIAVRAPEGCTGTFVIIANGLNSPTYTDMTGVAGQTYGYAAENSLSGVASPPSACVSITIPGGTNVHSVTLTWVPGTNGVTPTNFVVSRALGACAPTATFATIATPTAASYVDLTVAAATTYAYQVQAAAGTVVSGPSNCATAVVPANAPTPAPAVPGSLVGTSK